MSDYDEKRALLNPLILPAHVGIIMDGNGRWARKRNLPRTSGHLEGLKAAKRTVKAASETGIPFVSLYIFSTENWKRSQEEVSFLMGLLKQHLKKEIDFYDQFGIRIAVSGKRDNVPESVLDDIDDIQEMTKNFNKTVLNLAINYGGRDEIIRAFNRWLGNQNQPGAVISQEDLSRSLDQPGLPDLDLIIRTGGDHRISNFFLWQSAYAELYFTNILWPDWYEEHFVDAILDYQKRDRRYGGVK